jgi:hypothetical protein
MKTTILASTALCASLLLGSAHPPPPASDFEFVVIGDTRPRFLSENFRVFEGLIPKINALRPAFTINLGDLIYGYGPRPKAGQWDKYQQVIRQFAGPYHQLPGNHDTYSAYARRVYGQRFGKFYESFDYGDSHFVLLDNGEEGQWGEIGPVQLDWLKNDLRSTRATSIFVFMHFPTWEQDRVVPKYHVFWRDTLHPLFRQAKVKAVFGGHFHCYGPSREFDGIRYFITGGGGAELRPDYRDAGGEHHFVKVRVSGGRFEVRVMTDRGELQDVDADLMGGFLFAEQNTSRIGIVRGTQDLKQGVRFELQLANPYAEMLSGTAAWNFEPSQFEMTPPNRVIHVPGGGTIRLAFTFRALRDNMALDAMPWVKFDLSAGPHRHRFHRVLLFLQSLSAGFRVKPPVLDGDLADWAGAPTLRVGTGASAAVIRAANGPETLYLAIDVPVSDEPLSDDSAFSDALQVGFARRSGETDFGGETLRVGVEASDGNAQVGDRTPGRRFVAPLPGVKTAVRRDGNRRTFEMAIPTRLLGRADPGSTTSVVLSLSYPLPASATKPGDAAAEPSPNSLAYQVRYGGDVLVPVHFVELVLGRRR